MYYDVDPATAYESNRVPNSEFRQLHYRVICGKELADGATIGRMIGEMLASNPDEETVLAYKEFVGDGAGGWQDHISLGFNSYAAMLDAFMIARRGRQLTSDAPSD